MKHKGLYIAIIMMLVSLTSLAQSLPVESDSIRLEKYRTEIGLDMSVFDFDTKKIDSKVMGTRLAGILDYLMDNYHQSVYNRKLSQILKEQDDVLGKSEFEIQKLQFDRASKKDDEIIMHFTVWSSKNIANVNKTSLVFRFKDGVSDCLATNKLLSMMSRYVQRREVLLNLSD